MADPPFKKPLTAAQIKAREIAKTKSAARSKATAQKKAELNRNLSELSVAERICRLTPKLRNGKVILSDGMPALLKVDWKTEALIAQYGTGEFWRVDHLLRPYERADKQQIIRAGFEKPHQVPIVFRRRANELQKRVDREAATIETEAT